MNYRVEGSTIIKTGAGTGEGVFGTLIEAKQAAVNNINTEIAQWAAERKNVRSLRDRQLAVETSAVENVTVIP